MQRRSLTLMVLGGAAALACGLVLSSSAAAAATAPQATIGAAPAQVVLPPLPPIDLPPITLPPIDLPGLPPITLPPVDLLPVDLPPVTLPSLDDAPQAAPAPTPTTPVDLAAPPAPSVSAPASSAGASAVSTDVGLRSLLGTVEALRLIDAARASLGSLGTLFVAPDLVGRLASLVDTIAAGATQLTSSTLLELRYLVAELEATLPLSLLPLVAPLHDLVGGLIDPLLGVVDGTPLPPASLPGAEQTQDDDRGLDADRSTANERGNAQAGDDPASDDPANDDPASPRSIPTSGDLALFGSPLLAPAPVPAPVRGGSSVDTGTAPGIVGARSERSYDAATLPADLSTGSPREARAPPASGYVLRTLGSGPDTRPG